MSEQFTEQNEIGGLTKHRIEALTDGVFAIAMTLLILEIKVPVLPDPNDHWEMVKALLHLWPKLTSYVLSFFVLGVYWVGHHNQFHYIRRTDRVLLWINILFLMGISAIPFSAALLGEYKQSRIAISIYGLNLIAIGMIVYWHWWYAWRKAHVMVDKVTERTYRLAARRILFAPIGAAVAIGVSFLSPGISVLIYAALLLLYILPGKIDKEWRR